jgi:glucose/arabinose dehydrogenase
MEAGGAIPPLKLTQVATGLDAPVFVTSEPANPSRLYVVELTGTVRIIDNGQLLPGTFLDISADTKALAYTGDERGFWSIAFHPDYAANGRFFVFHTNAQSHNIVEEFHRSAADPNKSDPTPAKALITTNMAAANHNGGQLAFGPDGKLYVGVGDGGNGGGPQNGQDVSSLLGKILRIDVDTYPTPPAGNLPGGNPHIWDYGLRNPWRFSFDPCNGNLYIGDVGESTVEEVDVEPPGQGNANYGWAIMEGDQCHSGNCNTPGLVAPVVTETHAQGFGSMTGGYVYRGTAIGGLQGVYFYADFSTKKVKAFRYANGMATNVTDLTADLQSTSLTNIPSFGSDVAGNVYVIDIGGTVYRIDAE